MKTYFLTSPCKTLQDVLKSRKMIESDTPESSDLLWADVQYLFLNFPQLQKSSIKKINHFKNHYELTKKDLLAKNVYRSIKSYPMNDFNIVPPTFLLPQEKSLFLEFMKKKKDSECLWIMKPTGRSQGKGIFLMKSLKDLNSRRLSECYNSSFPRRIQGSLGSEGNSSLLRGKTKGLPIDSQQQKSEIDEQYIVQLYLSDPLLIAGKKFDLRLYCLVTKFDPLTVYLHRKGFCRFSSVPYNLNDKSVMVHTTNVSIQKTSDSYDRNIGCKWKLNSFRKYIQVLHGDQECNLLFNRIETTIVKSLLSVKNVMIQDSRCFELYGYDILIDKEMKPWLLEVNASPSLSVENQMDYDTKFDVLSDMLSILESSDSKNEGGFDLIYRGDEGVEQEYSNEYVSMLGLD